MVESEDSPNPVGLISVGSALTGAGSSTTAGALAATLCTQAPTVLVDQAPHQLSPWPIRVRREAADRTTRNLHCTCHEINIGPEATFDVLTDLTAPVAAGNSSRSWCDALTACGWSTVLTDLGTPLLDQRGNQAACGDRPGVLVLVMPATRPGVAAATRLITGWEDDGGKPHAVIVAALARAPGSWDRRVLADLTMLERRTSAVTRLPFDPALHREGVAGLDRMSRATRRAVHRLAALAAKETSQIRTPSTPTAVTS